MPGSGSSGDILLCARGSCGRGSSSRCKRSAAASRFPFAPSICRARATATSRAGSTTCGARTPPPPCRWARHRSCAARWPALRATATTSSGPSTISWWIAGATVRSSPTLARCMVRSCVARRPSSRRCAAFATTSPGCRVAIRRKPSDSGGTSCAASRSRPCSRAATRGSPDMVARCTTKSLALTSGGRQSCSGR